MSDEKSAKAELKDEMLKQVKSPQFVVVALLFVVFELVIVFGIDTSSRREELQWHWLSLYFLILCGLTPITMDSKLFFRGGIADDATDTQSSALVGSSAFISWIFAKSITNASKKGGSYGICGGFGYAAWYLAFPSAAVACYQLRRKGYKSLPGAIHAKYGTCAVLVFACCVLYRLYNEVWSNSRVIADFYGRETKNYKLDDGTTETVDASDPWWAAAIIATALPLCYVFAGGMRSSLLSDSAQAFLAVVTLAVVLVAIQYERASNDDLRKFAKSYSHWGLFQWVPKPELSPLSLKGGMDMFALGAVQGGFSYAFFDPVLTDRCFLADPKTMARCFTVGGFAAAWFITLFSIIGVHGSMLGKCVSAGYCDSSDLRGADVAQVTAGAPHAVAQTLGTVLFSFINIIMVTSGISTLDSTFTSVAKLVGPDVHGFLTTGKPMPLADATKDHVNIGRAAMVLVAVVGTLPLLDNPAELDATTVAGTIVMGLGAPIYMLALLPKQLEWKGTRPLAFLVPVLTCAALGICFRLSTAKDKHKELKYPGIAKNIDFSYLNVGEGVYRTYLGINILGACISLGAWFLFTFDWCWFVDEGDEFEPAQKALLVADEPSEDDVEMVKPPNPPSAAEEMSLAVGGRAADDEPTSGGAPPAAEA
ncbi:hypothetical protein AURANDRAFT_63673 [Aureococcus anophagefferens]|uniref:Uncharacterized protein n=1 Tax=Aureococcus anophagefferens TaxID=44056 RepID=F0Y6R0_AURAN|nr:hypothetical protein AURANDRAFT_63673 [Aureococcus anophagefferens]EGB09061.1 hypothetical protein AURANDRAFT_63673 [Aureococcus anophagefferens]|eukprot:XP_009036186.1 hypothetical protein AURANDRAFT_63673 [Aureococcus anophagefferens]